MRSSHPRYDLLRKRLDLFNRMLPGIEEGDIRALHRMRVASRRLRELLPILQLDRDVARKLGRRLRRVTKRLGAVRELDVLILLLNELHESSRYHEGGLSRVSAEVSRSRDEAREALEEKLPKAALRRLASKLEDVAESLRAAPAGPKRRQDTVWRWAVEARIASRAKRLADAMRDAGALYLPERLHAVRIAVKKVRYSVELEAELARVKHTPDLRTLTHAQDVLGRMHDLQVLIDRVRQIQAAAAADVRTERELQAMVDTLENDCRRLHARYVRDRAALAAMCARRGAAADGLDPAGCAASRRELTRA